jgi:hypothetical protein
VDGDQGEMTVNHSYVFRVVALELRQHGRNGCATRSLEVAVFDDRHFGGIRPLHPV